VVVEPHVAVRDAAAEVRVPQHVEVVGDERRRAAGLRRGRPFRPVALAYFPRIK